MAAVLTAAALATPGAPVGATPATAPSMVSFTPATGPITNPERGYYHYTATHFRGSANGDAPLNEGQLKTWRAQEGVTLVLRMVYLEDFTDRPLSDAALVSLADDLGVARRAGVKLIVRFAYSEDTDRDAAAPVVVKHIVQLAPVLNRNADVVAFLHAGFIGRWGEWYYSRSFAHDPTRPWDLSADDWFRRRAVLAALLSEVSPTIPLQLRYVGAYRELIGSDSQNAARVGIHDDCFLASDTDYGTFQNSEERSWLAAASGRVPVGGETCAVNAPRSGWASAQSDLAIFHWTYLNADYHRDVLASWGTGGRQTVEQRLGYRLRLTAASMPRSTSRNTPVELRLTLANDGYAAARAGRPSSVVFTSGTTRVAVPIPVDVSDVPPGGTQEYVVRVPAPGSAGSWVVRLWLPDRAPALTSNPAYSIRLANGGTWDASTGDNLLGLTLTVG